MEPTEPSGASREAQTIEELRRENESLRRRVAELEGPARRYQALYDGGVVSVQIYRDGYSAEANPCFDRLWRLRPEDVHGKYSLLEDAQVAAGGFMPAVERAFRDGEATRLPTIRYDPVELTGYGAARWVASALIPVNGPAGPIEVIQLHMDVGELKRSEDELRAQKQHLEAAVAERTAELAEQLRISEEQQRAIAALSTPVLRVWSGILALPLIGHIDPDRAARVLDVLLQRIVATAAQHVIIDVTGVPQIDAQAAQHLRDTVRAAELLGARCMIVGISGHTARMLVECDLDFEGVPTFATLQEGLRRLLSAAARAL
ncbi:STAS domain-containing protein [Sorangium sp. So ce315]|uniref:STAS domain-containing protein n=1 Tax=Sorangium sp. So ce315 TaxID=3133299 RepID=UPI003F5E2C18